MQYYPEDWRRDDPARFRHGYDRRRSGLAAMGVVQVARYALRHTRKRTFDPKLAGWWLVEIPPWNIPWMPNPAGYCTKHPGAAPDTPVSGGSPRPPSNFSTSWRYRVSRGRPVRP
jgi:hypothetical protein